MVRRRGSRAEASGGRDAEGDVRGAWPARLPAFRRAHPRGHQRPFDGRLVCRRERRRGDSEQRHGHAHRVRGQPRCETPRRRHRRVRFGRDGREQPVARRAKHPRYYGAGGGGGPTRQNREDLTVAKAAKVVRLEAIAAQIRVCTKCPLCQSRTLAVPGDGKTSARVMLIGEAPGREEDETGHPFVGAAGRFLDHVLEGTGINRDDLFITNIVKCRPPNNRTPRVGEVETCTSNYLFEQIELINPALIMLLGGVAAKKMLGVKSVNEARGRLIERDGRKYLVGYHPAVRFYREDLGEKVMEDFALLKHVLKKLSL